MIDLLDRVRQGHTRSIARVITRVENDAESAETAVTHLYPFTGNAHIIGVTGAPGSGKSTLVNELAKAFRQRDKLVGIIAVDPSSPFTGGALLGDRVRMRDLSGDKGIFIRSMASRGSLGGLAQATAAAIKVLDAGGFDVVLVETVGAGQAEVDIASTAHTTLVIEAPGMGDDIQSIKAGILEIADILVVNKADRPGAARTVRSLNMMLELGQNMQVNHHGRTMPAAGVNGDEPEPGWRIPVQETVAMDGQGIPELVDAIVAHRAFLQASGQWAQREFVRSRREVEQLLHARLMTRLEMTVPQANHDKLITAVARRQTDPYTAVAELFTKITN